MKKTVWILLDDRNGSVSQAKGVENELDREKFEVIEKQISYNIFAGLPNFLRGKTLFGLDYKSRSLFGGPMPDIVLSSSRRTVPVARYIKKISGGKTKLVQLMHPGLAGMEEFSLTWSQIQKVYQNEVDSLMQLHNLLPQTNPLLYLLL